MGHSLPSLTGANAPRAEARWMLDSGHSASRPHFGRLLDSSDSPTTVVANRVDDRSALTMLVSISDSGAVVCSQTARPRDLGPRRRSRCRIELSINEIGAELQVNSFEILNER